MRILFFLRSNNQEPREFDRLFKLIKNSYPHHSRLVQTADPGLFVVSLGVESESQSMIHQLCRDKYIIDYQSILVAGGWFNQEALGESTSDSSWVFEVAMDPTRVDGLVPLLFEEAGSLYRPIAAVENLAQPGIVVLLDNVIEAAAVESFWNHFDGIRRIRSLRIIHSCLIR